MTATTIPAVIDTEEVRRAAALLRPDADPIEVAARAAWSVLVEPGDGVAGALIAACDPAEALRLALSDTALLPVQGDPRAMAEARRRWLPRARPAAIVDALHGCRDVGGRMLLPGDPEWPSAVDDLGAHAPVVLWTRGDPGVLVDAVACW